MTVIHVTQFNSLCFYRDSLIDIVLLFLDLIVCLLFVLVMQSFPFVEPKHILGGRLPYRTRRNITVFVPYGIYCVCFRTNLFHLSHNFDNRCLKKMNSSSLKSKATPVIARFGRRAFSDDVVKKSYPVYTGPPNTPNKMFSIGNCY